MCPSIERFLLQVVSFRVRLDPSTEASFPPMDFMVVRCGSLTPTCSGTANMVLTILGFTARSSKVRNPKRRSKIQSLGPVHGIGGVASGGWDDRESEKDPLR